MQGRFRYFENGRVAGAKALAKNKSVHALASSNHWSYTENNSNNAWNAHFYNGYTNNNNKYNNYVVRAVAALTEDEIQLWIDAYDDCCRNKRTSTQCTLYRLRYEEDLLMLAAEVKMRVYEQKASEAFCVKYPKVREIFAADFRDRVAQHWIIRHLEPMFEDLFVEVGDVSYNCRKGYGMLAAARKQEENLRKVTHDWAEDAWVGCGDISAFFMSIDTRLMWHMLQVFIAERYRGEDAEDLLWLCKAVILHEPQHNCIRKGDITLWSVLPKHKSLFGSEPYKGMPIGNITTQQMANFFMSAFDRWAVARVAAFGGTYIRFVDDTRVAARSKEDIIAFYKEAFVWLRGNLGLTLHPDKHYLQPARHGDAFVGAVIKPHRVYISNRTRGRMTWRLRQMDMLCNEIVRFGLSADRKRRLNHYVSAMNSYMGFLIHYNTYAIRVKAFTELATFWKFCSVMNRYSIVKLKKRIL